MKNKRRLSIDYFEKKMKKLHKHNNRFTDYDIHHTQLTSLLQTTSFNGYQQLIGLIEVIYLIMIKITF